jgi:hypothetical protein
MPVGLVIPHRHRRAAIAVTAPSRLRSQEVPVRPPHGSDPSRLDDSHEPVPATGLSPEPLWTLVRAVDTIGAGARPGDGAVVRVATEPMTTGSPSGQLTWFPLDGGHPLDLLLGLVAPPHWAALGICCSGEAHSLDIPGRTGPEATSPGDDVTAGLGRRATGVRMTMLIDRAGATAGLLRQGDEVNPMPDTPGGTVADACRRAFGLPTAPPPASTTELWTLLWLDRVVAQVSSGARWQGRDAAWAHLASLHPAAVPLGRPRRDSRSAHQRGTDTPVDATELAARSRAHAAAWPWARLREEPKGLDLPGIELPVGLAGWMDDGMWARWLLGALPPAADLLDAVGALLPPALAEPIVAVVQSSFGGTTP